MKLWVLHDSVLLTSAQVFNKHFFVADDFFKNIRENNNWKIVIDTGHKIIDHYENSFKKHKCLKNSKIHRGWLDYTLRTQNYRKESGSVPKAQMSSLEQIGIIEDDFEFYGCAMHIFSKEGILAYIELFKSKEDTIKGIVNVRLCDISADRWRHLC
jgi:hypothetical protein